MLAGASLAVGAAVPRLALAARRFFGQGSPAIGLQLYVLGDMVDQDLDGALTAVAAIGYRTVELPGFYGRTARELKTALGKAGLECRSAHVPGQKLFPGHHLDGDVPALIADAHMLGLEWIVMPMFPIPERFGPPGAAGLATLREIARGLTLDDWRRTADFLNVKGAALKAGGLKLAYHNHNVEFAALDDTTGFDSLMEHTDPELVSIEMDVGWVVAAGRDPVEILRRHPDRVRLIHVKDLKAAPPNTELSMESTTVGAGSIDWKRLLAAANAAGVGHYYVEQEPPYQEPRIDAARRSYQYLAQLSA